MLEWGQTVDKRDLDGDGGGRGWRLMIKRGEEERLGGGWVRQAGDGELFQRTLGSTLYFRWCLETCLGGGGRRKGRREEKENNGERKPRKYEDRRNGEK